MKRIEPEIKNQLGETLDTWVEIPDKEITATVIMVHGFGTDKHETAGYFDDVSKALINDSFRVIRFDFSGYGKSEGKQEDGCYSKHVGDLQSILSFAKNSFSEPIYIFAQSMGCFVTALTSSGDIVKTMMTGIPYSDTEYIIDRFVKRFGTRPGSLLDMDGVSELPRSSGKIQKLGKKFWDDLRSLDPIKEVASYSEKTKLLIIHWLSDEVLGKEHLNDYEQLPGLEARWMDGDHSVSKFSDRQNLIKVMLEFYNHE